MYNLELVNWFLTANNYLKIRSKDAPFILNRGIDDISDGLFVGEKDSINSPLLSYLASAGYHAQLSSEHGEKVLEVWVPGLIAFKRVDWSIIQHKGTTIQKKFHSQVDKLVGGHIQRGDRVLVKVNYKGQEYNGFIRNADRDVTSDTYQFYYSTDKRLENEVSNFFGDLVNQLEPHKPAIDHSYFELVARKEPRAINLNLYNCQMDLTVGIQFEQYIRAFAIISTTMVGNEMGERL